MFKLFEILFNRPANPTDCPECRDLVGSSDLCPLCHGQPPQDRNPGFARRDAAIRLARTSE